MFFVFELVCFGYDLQYFWIPNMSSRRRYEELWNSCLSTRTKTSKKHQPHRNKTCSKNDEKKHNKNIEETNTETITKKTMKQKFENMKKDTWKKEKKKLKQI